MPKQPRAARTEFATFCLTISLNDRLNLTLFECSGQTCSALKRLYVHNDIATEFCLRLSDRVCSYKIGDPTSMDTFIGPLTRPQAAGELQAQIRDAFHQGASKLFQVRSMRQHSKCRKL